MNLLLQLCIGGFASVGLLGIFELPFRFHCSLNQPRSLFPRDFLAGLSVVNILGGQDAEIHFLIPDGVPHLVEDTSLFAVEHVSVDR